MLVGLGVPYLRRWFISSEAVTAVLEIFRHSYLTLRVGE